VDSRYVGHKAIKMFSIDGEFDDDRNLLSVRERFEMHLVNIMRSKGYVPHLDIEPAFSLEYIEDKYKFLLSIYGVYIGRAKAKCYLAVSGNNLIPMEHTQKIK
jgi:hypothetical protein